MRKLILILLSFVALVNVSCERRELVEISNTHYVRVYIKEDIKNVTMGFHENAEVRPKYKSPDILRLLLFNPQTGMLKAERFLRTKKQDERGTYYEGYIVTEPGYYNLVAYNWGTEVCIVRNYADFNGAQVYTNEIATHLKTRLSSMAKTVVRSAMRKEMQKVMQKMQAAMMVTKADERSEDRIVYDPDHLFLANCGNVYVPYTDMLDTLKTPEGDHFVAESIVKSYYLEIPVKGIEYATSSVGLVSGMAGSAWLGTASMNEADPVAIYLELQPGGDNPSGLVKAKAGSDGEGQASPTTAVMYTTFNTFGRLPDAETGLSITFDFLTTHGGSHTQTVDITDEFTSQMAQENQWIVVGDDKTIELPDPPEYPSPETGGGFKPDIGGWEDVETDIIM